MDKYGGYPALALLARLHSQMIDEGLDLRLLQWGPWWQEECYLPW